ncbi:hypothetical protein BT69DRAFT_1257986 [Atractiella rhizophila]|nr:hypothetical protein BT69DRAFT_1257986 [Atractiella rhizophila]
MSRQEVMMEFAALDKPQHLPLGMYVMPEKGNINVWHIILFLHRGYYSPSLLRFTLSIPSSYPSPTVLPTLTSLTNVFHPLIDPSTGRFNLESRFPRWRPRKDFLFHILHFLKASFKRNGLEGLVERGCANLEAYRMYRNNPTLFTKLASQSASLSMSDSTLYDRPFGNAPKGLTRVGVEEDLVRFERMEEGEEEHVKEEMRRFLGVEGKGETA